MLRHCQKELLFHNGSFLCMRGNNGDEPITYIFDKHTTRLYERSLSVPYRIQQVMEVVHVTVQ